MIHILFNNNRISKHKIIKKHVFCLSVKPICLIFLVDFSWPWVFRAYFCCRVLYLGSISCQMSVSSHSLYGLYSSELNKKESYHPSNFLRPNGNPPREHSAPPLKTTALGLYTDIFLKCLYMSTKTTVETAEWFVFQTNWHGVDWSKSTNHISH